MLHPPRYSVAAVHHDTGVPTSSSSTTTTTTTTPPTNAHAVPLALTFSRDGSILFAAQTDSSLLLYNTTTSKQINVFRQLEMGVSLVEPTHQKFGVICAPARTGHRPFRQKKMPKIDANRLFCWDVYSNSVVGFLKGHTNDIQSMDVCDIDETVLSTDIMGQVRLWDIRAGSNCVAMMESSSSTAPCAAAFNSTGTLLGIAGVDDQHRPQVNFFDRRALVNGPVSTTHHKEWDQKSTPKAKGGYGSMNGFSRIKFSPDSQMVVVTPYEMPNAPSRKREERPPLHTVLSLNEGNPHQQEDGDSLYAVEDDLGDDVKRWYRPEASFSKDSKYIIFGDEGKNIQVWGKGTGDSADGADGETESSTQRAGNGGGEGKKGGLRRCAVWRGHISTIGPIRWSPTMDLVASGGGNLLMWLPDNSAALESAASPAGDSLTSPPATGHPTSSIHIASALGNNHLAKSALRAPPLKSAMKKH